MFPVTRSLRGGKGVATVGGGMLVLHPITSGLLIGSWVLIRRLSGTASVASLVVAVALPIGVAIEGSRGWEVAAIVGLAALVMVRHLDNVKRLLGGRELGARHRATGDDPATMRG
jgi:glycerol-3-phosphate acyltransferase PlsY